MSTMSEIQPHRAQDWLKPPGPTIELDHSKTTKARRALTVLRRAVQNANPYQIRTVLMAEAYASSLIENIDQNPHQEENFANALYQALDEALENTQTTDPTAWHRTLMESHPDPRMSPGHYRGLNVRVGRWFPPTYQRVPAMMQELLDWLGNEPEPLMRAVWGHRYYETIHPFADGNGRTGRVLICQTLACPIMISRHIWHERNNYIKLLDSGDWQEWSDWMLDKIVQAAYATATDLNKTDEYSDIFKATQWIVNRVIPKPPHNAHPMELAHYYSMTLQHEPKHQ